MRSFFSVLKHRISSEKGTENVAQFIPRRQQSVTSYLFVLLSQNLTNHINIALGSWADEMEALPSARKSLAATFAWQVLHLQGP